MAIPALVSSKKQAKVTDTKQRLRNCQVAVSLYRADNQGAGSLPLDLPGYLDVGQTIKKQGHFYGMTWKTMTSACGQHPKSLTPIFLFMVPDIEDKRGIAYFDLHGERSILALDENCNDPSTDITADFVTKRALGVLVDGTLVDPRHTGKTATLEFWENVK